MKYIGVDGCHYGWLAVILEEDSPHVAIFKDISELWEKHQDAELILVDVPIGLKDSGCKERTCDIEARKYISKRHSSVFRVPCRSAVYANKDEASRINYKKTGKCLPEQAKGIIRKIKEVDNLLCKRPEARLCISETHPEVCFWALNGKREMKFYKKKRQGFDERKTLLSSIYPLNETIIDVIIDEVREKRQTSKDVARDNILDALAAAVTASKQGLGLKSLPEAPENDGKGLPMQIMYYSV